MADIINNAPGTPPVRVVRESDASGWAVAVIILIVVIGGGLYWYSHHRAAATPAPGVNLQVNLPAGGTNDSGNTNGGTSGTSY